MPVHIHTLVYVHSTCEYIHIHMHTHLYTFLKLLVSAKRFFLDHEDLVETEICTLLLGSLHSSQKDNEHVNKVISGTDSAINCKCLV